MKIKFKYIAVIALCVAAASCKKDNYTPPSSTLSGHIVYKGEAIGVERDQVPYQLYQYGFGKIGPVGAFGDNDNSPTTFAQDGSYSALLFDGNYKLLIPNGQGPFMWKQTVPGVPDSLAITLKGNQTLDLEVTPYYMIRTPQMAFTPADSMVTATCKLEQIITDSVNKKGIDRVSLYINKTTFVSGGDNIAGTDLAGTAITDPNNISLSVKVPAIVPIQHYVFARIGIKISGLEDMIFSPVQKIQF